MSEDTRDQIRINELEEENKKLKDAVYYLKQTSINGRSLIEYKEICDTLEEILKGEKHIFDGRVKNV